LRAAGSDAFVFFGATGDLAHKKVFVALQALAARNALEVPVIGVAKAGWDRDRLVAWARDGITKHGGAAHGLDETAFARLERRLRYIDGDYADPATFAALRRELGDARRPLHYLAIPPSLFGNVVGHLGNAGLAEEGRVVVEKPFGRDLASAQALNADLLQVFPEERVYRIDHFLGKSAVDNILFFRFANTYVAAHKGTAFNGVTEEMLGAFRMYLEAEKFDYQEESEMKVKELRKVGEQSHYSKEVLADLDMLGAALEKEKLRGFDRYKDHIAHELDIELMARLKGEHGRIEASLKEDALLKAAVGILKDRKLYARKLGA